MVILSENDLQIFKGKSSKGNQNKWNAHNIWYKADYAGYEGLSEYIISHLLTHSELNPSEFVLYNTEKIQYKHSEFRGVKSENFLKKDCQLITLERLYSLRYGRDFTKDVWHIHDIEERLSFIVDRVFQMTGLADFGKYMNKILTIDALFLNEDRHLHNIAVIKGPDNHFEYCPLFDHGAGLLSDTTIDYPLDTDIFELIKDVKGKTISTDFNDALDASEHLFGQNLHFNFTKKDVSDLLSNDDVYDNRIKIRVEDILREQMRKYQYLFTKSL